MPASVWRNKGLYCRPYSLRQGQQNHADQRRPWSSSRRARCQRFASRAPVAVANLVPRGGVGAASEKSVTQQAGLIRRTKASRQDPADLAGVCSGRKFVVSRAGEAYDVRASRPDRKFRLICFCGCRPILGRVVGRNRRRANTAQNSRSEPFTHRTVSSSNAEKIHPSPAADSISGWGLPARQSSWERWSFIGGSANPRIRERSSRMQEKFPSAARKYSPILRTTVPASCCVPPKTAILPSAACAHIRPAPCFIAPRTISLSVRATAECILQPTAQSSTALRPNPYRK
jgi:hypothetical protein